MSRFFYPKLWVENLRYFTAKVSFSMFLVIKLSCLQRFSELSTSYRWSLKEHYLTQNKQLIIKEVVTLTFKGFKLILVHFRFFWKVFALEVFFFWVVFETRFHCWVANHIYRIHHRRNSSKPTDVCENSYVYISDD